MIIIGEKLNSSIPKTLEAMNSGDMPYLQSLACAQAEHGADFLDINTALCGPKQSEVMKQILEMVQKECTCGIMLDTTAPTLMKEMLPKVQGRNVILNSLTLTQRFDEVAALAKEYSCGVVALPIDNHGIPKTAQKRTGNSIQLIEKLLAHGIKAEQIYIDVLCEAMAVEDGAAMVTLQTIQGLKAQYPHIKTTLGLSNVSFGLPKRAVINASFLSAAIYCGLDSAIMDPTSPSLRSAMFAALALSGQDEYCMDYIRASR